MKYFTPELFVELNSDDDKIVDRAEEKWQKALRGYRQHLKRIGDKLPVSLKRFSDEYCLHDANVLPPSERNEDFLPLLRWTPDRPQPDSTSAVISVKSKDALLVLWYFNSSKRPVIEKPVDSPVYYSDQVIWLYDEIDRIDDEQFSHEILFSNGIVAKLNFRDFLFVEHLDFRTPTVAEFQSKVDIHSKVS